jgi:hypothetical protein
MRRTFLFGHACRTRGGWSDDRSIKPVVAQQHTDAALPIDPAILKKHLENIREQMTLP